MYLSVTFCGPGDISRLCIRVIVSRRCWPVSVCDITLDPCVSVPGIHPSNPMPASGHIRPENGMLIVAPNRCSETENADVIFQVIIHSHAKGMKSVISIFQRYQQHKCVTHA